MQAGVGFVAVVGWTWCARGHCWASEQWHITPLTLFEWVAPTFGRLWHAIEQRLARPIVGVAQPCEANTACLLRLRRTDNRPRRIEYNRGAQSADSRCYPEKRVNGVKWHTAPGGMKAISAAWVFLGASEQAFECPPSRACRLQMRRRYGARAEVRRNWSCELSCRSIKGRIDTS